MRQIDQPSVSVSVEVDATPEAIWPYVIDINSPIGRSKELVGARWLGGATEPSLGGSFEGTNRVGDSEWTTENFVTALSVNEVFEWTTESVENPVATWRFSIEDLGERSRLNFFAQLGLAENGISPHYKDDPEAEDRLLTRRLQVWTENMLATINGIKAAVEGA